MGATVSYTLSKAASVKFRVERAASGRRVRGRCVAPKRPERRARKCIRYVTLRGRLTHQGRAGANKFRFTGRLRGRKLASGHYRLRGDATHAAANQASVKRIGFVIVSR